MDMFSLFSIKCKNFKPFGDQPAGFECLKHFNVIIGRNNSGKTTLLDLLEFAKESRVDLSMGHKGLLPEIVFSMTNNSRVYEFLSGVEKMEIFNASTGGMNMFNGRLEWSKKGAAPTTPARIEHSNPQQRGHQQDPTKNAIEAIFNRIWLPGF